MLPGFKLFFFWLVKFKKYAYALLAVAIFLILLKALIYPTTVDILVVLILFCLLIVLI